MTNEGVLVRLAPGELELLDGLRNGETRPACFRRLLREATAAPVARPVPSAVEALELLAEQARAGRTVACVAYARLMVDATASEQDRYEQRRLDELAQARESKARIGAVG